MKELKPQTVNGAKNQRVDRSQVQGKILFFKSCWEDPFFFNGMIVNMSITFQGKPHAQEYLPNIYKLYGFVYVAGGIAVVCWYWVSFAICLCFKGDKIQEVAWGGRRRI